MGLASNSVSIAWSMSRTSANDIRSTMSEPIANVFGIVANVISDKVLRTGAKVWVFATKGHVDSSPVIAADRVYVGSNDGNIYGIGLDDGTEKWKFNAGRPITASPAVGEGCLVIGSESNTGTIYCFGAK